MTQKDMELITEILTTELVYPAGLYLYRSDGMHSGAVWFSSSEELLPSIPAIISVISQEREVMITDSDNLTQFHYCDGEIHR